MNLFAVRPQLDRVLYPLVSRLARLPLRANHWTALGVLVGLGCAALLLSGRWWPALALLLARGLIDVVDGFVARSRDQRSTFGAILDDVADRWVLGVTYCAAGIHLSGEYPHVLVVLAFGVTGSLCNVVAKLSIYAESRHDGSRVEGKLTHPVDVVGLFGSAEFIIYFGAGVLVTAILDDPLPGVIGIWAVAVMSNVSLAQRLLFAWRRYRFTDPG